MIHGEHPLMLGGGYRTVKQYVRKELSGFSVRDVERNTFVATRFSAAEEIEHGFDFLEEIARWVQESQMLDEVPKAIRLARVRVDVPTGEGEDTEPRRAPECSLDDVRAARRRLRGARNHGAKMPPMERALRAQVLSRSALRGLTIRAGSRRASFGNVPIERLHDLGQALLAFEPPPDEHARGERRTKLSAKKPTTRKPATKKQSTKRPRR